MPNSTLAFFVRHGTTTLNEENKFRGPLNPPLDEKGMNDALQLKEFFKGTDFGEAITSDKLRAQQTAQAVLNGRNTEPMVTPALRALNVGYLGGQPKTPENLDVIQHYEDNPNDVIPQGESLNQFRGRVRPAIHFAVKRGQETGRPSIAFVHSSIIHELGNIFHGDHKHSLVKPGGVVAVSWDGKRMVAKPIVKPLNDKEKYGG